MKMVSGPYPAFQMYHPLEDTIELYNEIWYESDSSDDWATSVHHSQFHYWASLSLSSVTWVTPLLTVSVFEHAKEWISSVLLWSVRLMRLTRTGVSVRRVCFCCDKTAEVHIHIQHKTGHVRDINRIEWRTRVQSCPWNHSVWLTAFPTLRYIDFSRLVNSLNTTCHTFYVSIILPSLSLFSLITNTQIQMLT